MFHKVLSQVFSLQILLSKWNLAAQMKLVFVMIETNLLVNLIPTTVVVPSIILPEPQKSIETKGSLLCSEEAINVPPCVPQCQQASNVVQLTTLRLLPREINLGQQLIPFVDSKVPDAKSNGKSSSSLNSCVVQDLSAQNVVMANDVVTCHLSCRESKDVENQS
jgi:hypothetical protein